jgi:hypothetical protein
MLDILSQISRTTLVEVSASLNLAYLSGLGTVQEPYDSQAVSYTILRKRGCAELGMTKPQISTLGGVGDEVRFKPENMRGRRKARCMITL